MASIDPILALPTSGDGRALRAVSHISHCFSLSNRPSATTMAIVAVERTKLPGSTTRQPRLGTGGEVITDREFACR